MVMEKLTCWLSAASSGGGVNCSSFIKERPLLTRIAGNGDGTFALPARWDDCRVSKEVQQPWTSVATYSGLQAADTNGDGLADFLIAFALPTGNSSQANLGVYDDVSHATGQDTRRWIGTDLNGDGRGDFIYIQAQGGGTLAYSLFRDSSGEYDLKQASLPSFGNHRCARGKS